MKAILSVIFLLVSLTIPGLAATSAADYQVYLPLAMNVYGESACLPPALLEPADGSSLSTITPVFRWDRDTNSLATSLTIEVSTDPTFTSGIGRYTTTSAHWVDEFRFPNNLVEGSTYCWRAYVVCGSGDPVYSAAQSFTTPTNIPRLPAPTLAAPADQSTLPGITTTLEWQSINGASDYLVKWQKAGITSILSKFVPATQLQFNLGGLSSATEYEWWVLAADASAIGDEPTNWRFTTP